MMFTLQMLGVALILASVTVIYDFVTQARVSARSIIRKSLIGAVMGGIIYHTLPWILAYVAGFLGGELVYLFISSRRYGRHY